MRVLFLTLYPDVAASPRYRVTQYLPYLRDAGIDCTVAAPISEDAWRRWSGPGRTGRAFWYHAAETSRRTAQLLGSGRYDCVFVQKALTTAHVRGLDTLLFGRATRLIYDIDDAVHLAPPQALRGPWRALSDSKQIARMMRRADTVLAGNRWLCEEVRQAGGQPQLFPTVVDTERFRPVARRSHSYTIGWMGNSSTAASLRTIQGPLTCIDGAEVRIVGATIAETGLERAVHSAWSYATEADELNHFDVGIMPLSKTEWTRGKCALKALQYMACGIPCVSTPFGAITDIIEPGVTGLLADTNAEWTAAFEQLRDPAERARIGEAGRALVESRYSLAKAAPRLCALLETPS